MVDRDSRLGENPLCGVLTPPQARQIDPGKVPRIGDRIPRRRYVLGEQVGEEVPVRVERGE